MSTTVNTPQHAALYFNTEVVAFKPLTFVRHDAANARLAKCHLLAADFWLKTDTYLEQPEVTYTKELLLLAEGFKGGEPFSASFSSLGGINGLNHAGVRPAVVKVSKAANFRQRLVLLAVSARSVEIGSVWDWGLQSYTSGMVRSWCAIRRPVFHF